MSHSLLSASPRTHVKIVIVALVGAIMVVIAGIAAHVSANRDIARLQAHAPAIKASKLLNYSDQGRTLVR
jgi:hypothetical protein